MGKLRRIQSLVRNGLFYLTEHALEEAEDGDFELHDIANAILSGKIRRTWPRDSKFEIVGNVSDGRTMGIVCRITMGMKVRVITVYEDNPMQ